MDGGMNYSDVDIQQHNALNVYKTSLEVKVKNGKKYSVYVI